MRKAKACQRAGRRTLQWHGTNGRMEKQVEKERRSREEGEGVKREMCKRAGGFLRTAQNVPVQSTVSMSREGEGEEKVLTAHRG